MSMIRHLINPSPETLSSARGRDLVRTAAVTTLGFALYGFTVGYWRSPIMGGYVAVKMPLLIACTLACNGMLNGMLGLLLGSRLGFRQSLQALLSAFAISALILASIAPVTFFLAWNAPTPDSPEASAAHAGYLLTHTALIAIAGLIGVLRLGRLLAAYGTSAAVTRSTIAAWVAGNAFLGAQFSWILRPFFGTPTLEVAFLRENPMQGSFYEAVFRSLRRTLVNVDALTLSAGGLLALIALFILVRHIRIERLNPKTP